MTPNIDCYRVWPVPKESLLFEGFVSGVPKAPEAIELLRPCSLQS